MKKQLKKSENFKSLLKSFSRVGFFVSFFLLLYSSILKGSESHQSRILDFREIFIISSNNNTEVPDNESNKSQFAGGSGMPDDPYLIENAHQLNQVRNYLGASFKLISDIDLYVFPWNQDQGWLPIGTIVHPFTGSFDGDMFSISNLFINRPNTEYVGVFGFLTGAIVKNVFITNTNVKGSLMVGSIGGKGNFGTLFENIHVTNAHIQVTYRYSGGLIGGMDDCTVRKCSSNGVNIYTGYDWNFIGGLIGGVTSTTTNQGNLIEESYSKTNVQSFDHNSYGGLLGVTWIKTTIRNCYSMGDVLGSGDFVGGFLGEVGSGYSDLVLENNYSTSKVISPGGQVNGFLGKSGQGIFVGNFWDYETSGQNYDPIAIPKNTAQMKMIETYQYLGWDFDNIWSIDTIGNYNNGYPFLKFELELLNDCLPPQTITVSSLTDKSCVIQWINPSLESSYCQLIWGPKGFNPSTEGTLVDSISTQYYFLDSLTPVTAYDVYFRSKCNGGFFSNWSKKYSFKTFGIFSVSGVGTYCSNENLSRVKLLLSESQPDVNYVLVKNGISQSDTLTGTGNLLMWNNLTEGIYRVKAINAEASIFMRDSVVVKTIYPPAVIFDLQKDTLSVALDSFELSGGFPKGGVYSGLNVSSGLFYPSLAGVGRHELFYTFTDDYGCRDIASVHLSVVNYIDLLDIEASDLVGVYPNPVKDILQIEFFDHSVSAAEIKIFSADYRLVYSNTYFNKGNKVIINVSDFNNGIYHLEIDMRGQGTVKNRFIKL